MRFLRKRQDFKVRSKTKICIISTIKNAHIIRWSQALQFSGFDIVVITSEPNDWNVTNFKVIECISDRSKSYLHDLLLQFKHSLTILSVIKKINPDIVHIHSFDYIHPFMIAFTNIFISKFKNLVISTWGTDVIESQSKLITARGLFAKKLLLKQAKEITATSNYLASMTAKISPKNSNIHIIPFGIDCMLFKRKNRNKKNSHLKIGYIKHLTPKYGPDVLLKAFAIIFKYFENLKLVMVGHGEMEEELKKMAIRLGIRDSVEFTGYLQNEQIPAVLEKVDIFAMPSIIEAFGVAALEAQAMEIPVVASKVGGISEVVLDKETGILVEPKNVDQFASALKMLIENFKMRKNMGEAGRRFVVKNYNLEDNLLLFGRLYQKLVSP